MKFRRWVARPKVARLQIFSNCGPTKDRGDDSGAGEKIQGTGTNSVDETWDENFHIVFATRSGIVKKSNLSNYSNVRKGGIIAIQIEG